MKSGHDPRRLDVRRFAEERSVVGGETPLRDFPRLAAEAEGRGAETAVRWSAQGAMLNAGHVQPQVWIHVEADATLSLICQRCLAGVDVHVPVQRAFRFVTDEARAAAEDDESEEDVLAESRSFDLMELVEDELLMGVPVAPRHTACPVLPPFSAGEDEFEAAQEKRANPFAVLQSLIPAKPGKPGPG
ncbi:YceD family protein [Ramlibacter sp.]|uniref:YceD family protein n=1 Tax=Ramlibacter sp. TaxID=1917967 RepID=UPI003D14F6BD